MMMLYLPSGSPTVELFAASYNNRSNKSKTIELGLGTFGYTQNTGKKWLQTTDNHEIYNKSTSSYWWLASPYKGTGGDGLRVDRRNGNFSIGFVVDSSYPVRPLVCIPTSVFNSKYATDTTLVDQ